MRTSNGSNRSATTGEAGSSAASSQQLEAKATGSRKKTLAASRTAVATQRAVDKLKSTAAKSTAASDGAESDSDSSQGPYSTYNSLCENVLPFGADGKRSSRNGSA